MPSLIAEASRVNDFVVKFANVNGTGSASANSLIMKAIFRMGVPVTGKNYFPSNIQGLPTWYEIRVTRDGHVARASHVDIMVAMNAETYSKDIRELRSGGYLIYDSTWPRSALLQRGDITVIPVPLAKLVNENFDGVRNRILLKNIAYAGVLAALLDVDLEVISGLLSESYGKKPKLLDSNTKALRLGYDYVKENLAAPLPLRVEHMDKTRGHIMIDGNTAAGLGCVYAGATVGAWYPITPSTSLMDAFKGFCERYRVDPQTGERNFAVLQAEDELAAVGMVLGASWNGARAFTPTSGPGISLMNEFIGLAYYMAVQAFDVTERLQTPVFVMSDLDIGMNDWMCPDLKWDDAYQPDRGKVLSKQEIDGLEKFYRYLDRDDDAIPYRTLPGTTPKGAYFTRGSGHNQYGGYTEDSAEYQVVLDRLKRKFANAPKYLPKPVLIGKGTSPVGIVSIGSCDGAIREALDVLKLQKIEVDYLRVRAFPFNSDVEAFLKSHSTIFVVEQNRDAQLKSLLTLETAVEKAKLFSILSYSGLPISAQPIVDEIRAKLAEAPRLSAVPR
jgi:2-oxoglutarate ferredoxin oxidoreductase subunit alpha